ncbi:TRAP transporter substrate-binding protein DctP [Desulfosporosinus sp. BICA1-9]|uniref:TRAP transporter substrate-binding protein DctP n=1 Tax=Desulfosporosinus sp. BICA1-9 TaxID=1531958 RepID=UPI0005F15F9F|nr:TRAP transporter substrate-binding protein DctP [Desulfosporosinus sp. BICA1-9]KJS49299.1 MAG: hypothetical protein VR66_09340 [Peptococcaceae bacterium BRH_c23]KJS81208.1 MAG: hypothetical protein JL57_26995 [Desulfosporosinus sp. BICA1-9]HBW37521.1 C4-dicarboxylate ABC transporter substrate-binding protein [Desulfosporosinus sp.]
MRNKKLVYVVLAVFVISILTLTGCGQNKVADSKDAATPQKTIKIRMAGQYPSDHPGTQAMTKLKETVEAKTNGRIQMTLYPANQLGDYTLIYDEIMKGTIEMALISIPSGHDPKLELTYVPSIAENYDQVRKLYSQGSYIYNTMDQLNNALNVKLLGFNVEGFGGLGMTKLPEDPASVTSKKNVLLRVPPMDVFKVWADDMNYTTVTVPYAELYTALQTGVADGWSGGTPVSNWLGFRDVLKYYIPVNNFVENTSYVMNLDLWKSLSAEDQKIIADTTAELSTESVDISQKSDKQYMDEMKKAGIKVIELSDADLKTLADQTRKTSWPKLNNRLGKEIMDGLLKEYK